MIKTLTLNPAVDKTVTTEGFAVGRVNRITSVRLDAGGKGLNVARVLHRLGAPTGAVAPVAGATGRFLVDRCAEEGLPLEPIEVSGETRTNLKVVDPLAGTHTDLNEPGSPLSEGDLGRIEQRFFSGFGPGDWAVFSGSVPGNLPPDLYARWIDRARTLGVRTALDADGALLRAGIAARPDLVKPNLAELEGWVGRSLETDLDLHEAVTRLRATGVGMVGLSLGARGAWLATPEGIWSASAPRVRVLSPVGAGDALLAALVWGLIRGQDPGVTLGQAVATATASVVLPRTGAGEPGLIEGLLGSVTVGFIPV